MMSNILSSKCGPVIKNYSKTYETKNGDIEVYFDEYKCGQKLKLLSGKEVPFMMYEKEIDRILDSLGEDKVMLEWGSGGSTLFFSNYVKKLYSIEHAESFYYKVKEDLQDANIQNVELVHVPPVEVCSMKKRWDDYCNYVKEIDEKIDCVFIDGAARNRCADSLIEQDILHDDSVIFFHDCKKYAKLYEQGLEKYDIIETIDVFWPPNQKGFDNQPHMAILRRK